MNTEAMNKALEKTDEEISQGVKDVKELSHKLAQQFAGILIETGQAGTRNSILMAAAAIALGRVLGLVTAGCPDEESGEQLLSMAFTASAKEAALVMNKRADAAQEQQDA